jgi:hypothetical protein
MELAQNRFIRRSLVLTVLYHRVNLVVNLGIMCYKNKNYYMVIKIIEMYKLYQNPQPNKQITSVLRRCHVYNV